MKDFKGKVAVITGAASGIGRGLADRCAREGMKIVLADVEEAALARAENELKASGAEVLAVRTDVSKLQDVEKLADATLAAFGAVHLLFNNAGVTVSPQTIWRQSIADWQWVLGVNLWGAIHGTHVFVPIMLSQDAAGHVVNTASVSGLRSGASVYGVSKHAIIALSEALYRNLTMNNAKVKVSVLCPGYTNTQLLNADRNRPAELRNELTAESPDGLGEVMLNRTPEMLLAGKSPAEIADRVFAAIREEVFYIRTHPEFEEAIAARAEDIVSGRNPTLFPV